RRAHICDGKAVCEVIAYLKKNVAKNKITEMDVARMLSKHRREAGAVDDSFNAICGYAEHGAIVHYSANEKTNKQLEPRGLLLMDSGGQYKEGTTDVTRTVALGGMTAFERKCFTLVLKGMLALGEVKFKKGLTGANLDIIGRVPLYEHGLDYGHATGHGVGSFLSVHEYPNGFSAVNDCVFEAGMITSDEPGVYIEGQFGVRIENLMLCKEDDDGFLKFEFLTMVPIDKEAIDFSLMNDEDIHRLNEYHAMVRKNILPVISDEAREYLINATEEI
ncbi:MAG: M24 family metallopeptidase, partial [Clostridia bacterium]|nr:M24 family metallopeptidase [Clostridia bacterium]